MCVQQCAVKGGRKGLAARGVRRGSRAWSGNVAKPPLLGCRNMRGLARDVHPSVLIARGRRPLLEPTPRLLSRRRRFGRVRGLLKKNCCFESSFADGLFNVTGASQQTGGCSEMIRFGRVFAFRRGNLNRMWEEYETTKILEILNWGVNKSCFCFK